MRKVLAKWRHRLEDRGLTVRPYTHRKTGGYSGFSLTWGDDGGGPLRGAVCRVEHQHGNAVFFVEHERDFIQRMHLEGHFYEEDELALIEKHAKGGIYLDVGANVGNHAVFVGLFLPFEKIIAIEPNPATARVLETNLRLNGLFAKSEIKRVGLSDREAKASMVVPYVNNIGTAKVSDYVEGANAIELVRGDDILADETVGFVKMDVEGHELLALSGMQAMLARDKPTLLVEVENTNDKAVLDLMTGLGYTRESKAQFLPDKSNQLFVYR